MRIKLDSDPNISVITDITCVNTYTIQLCRKAEDATGAETADRTVMPIEGNGIIVGLEGMICKGTTHTLVFWTSVMERTECCGVF